MFITIFAQNYSQNVGNAISKSKTQKFKKSRGGNRMPPDTKKCPASG
jgi:hypothetical protein